MALFLGWGKGSWIHSEKENLAKIGLNLTNPINEQISQTKWGGKWYLLIIALSFIHDDIILKALLENNYHNSTI